MPASWGQAARAASNFVGRGVRFDLHSRLPWYRDDWREVGRSKRRVLASATFIFCASIVPALAFGQQLSYETNGALTPVQVLAATAIAGTAQAVVGGQPLLILGVSEPVVLVYKYMYAFARDRDALGPELFLAWAAWVCVWAAAMLLALALTNACVHINKFTRFAGEAFGALIAALFLQQAVKGVVQEFGRLDSGAVAGSGSGQGPSWKLVNGLWSLFLACGVLLTTLGVRRARRWRVLNATARGLLADYGVPLMVVAFTGLSYAVQGPGVPVRVATPLAWEVKESWRVVKDMGRVQSPYIAGALLPGAIVAVLFYFDHNVSAQLASQQEFGLVKPPAYHWDMLLLGVTTLICGLIGVPPTNGVIPQSPTHTKSLARTSKQGPRGTTSQRLEAGQGSAHQQQASTPPAMAQAPAPENGHALPGAVSSQGEGLHGAQLPAARPDVLEMRATSIQGGNVHVEYQGESSAGVGNGADGVPPSALQQQLPASRGPHGEGTSRPLQDAPLHQAAKPPHRLSVSEQRGSGLLQSVAVGLCLAAIPAIRCIPAAVLWGYFAFMAVDSLPGSQLWDRTLLLLTDPSRRHLVLEHAHAPYLETVRFRVVAAFTLLQLAAVGAIYALTWAGVAGILFPLPIMALVPLRHYALPRLFRPAELEELDAVAEEEAPALPHAEAVREAAEVGLVPRTPLDEQATGAAAGDSASDLDSGSYRVVHHVSHDTITRRRTATRSASTEAEQAATAVGGAGALSKGDDICAV